MNSPYTSYEDLLRRTIAKSPTMVVRTLSQIGYEPQPRSPTLWFDSYLFYPNPFRVLFDVVRNHGVLGLWHGAPERLLADLLWNEISKRLRNVVGIGQQGRGGDYALYLSYAKFVGCMMLADAVVQPIRVVALRKLLQVADDAQGQLTHNSITMALQIWREEGWCGLYSGLCSVFFLEVMTFGVAIALTNVKMKYPQGFGTTPLKRFATNALDIVMAYSVYSFYTVATVRMSGPAGLPPGQAPHMSWLHCLWDLALQKCLYRGVYTLYWEDLYMRISNLF